MKKYIWISIAFAMALLAYGCDDNYEKMYNGETTLYLNLSETQLDSMAYSFVGTVENKIVVDIPVEITGYAASYDRSFYLKVDASKSTAVAGKHYEPLKEEYVLEKDKYTVNVPVTLLYSGDLDSVIVRLALELQPGKDFTPGISYRQEALISFSNLVPTIKLWSAIYQSYFGDYSKVKHRYMLSELKLKELEDSVDFYYSMDRKLWAAYGLHMNNFFAEHQIYDEYNRLIEPWIK